MRRYWSYFKYVVRHKWFVALECWKRGLIWRGIKHDWDKFLPSSFIPYAKLFYNPDGTKAQVRDKTGFYKPEEQGSEAFKRAWLHHTRYHRHHWQYWVMALAGGKYEVYPMGKADILEMVCDWRGAGRAQGTPDTMAWWRANRNKMILHGTTLAGVEVLLWGEKL